METEAPVRPAEVGAVHRTDLGVALLSGVDVYLQSERAIKYALLFIGLTFAAFFLFEVLKELLQATPTDEAAVIRQAELVMDLEQQVKLTHLGLLLKLKNMMNETQIAQLEEFRKSWTRKKE